MSTFEAKSACPSARWTVNDVSSESIAAITLRARRERSLAFWRVTQRMLGRNEVRDAHGAKSASADRKGPAWG